MAPAEEDARKAEELAALLREVRDRVRARYPQGSAGPVEIALADLMQVVHARDAAEAKVAAIGTVNPRPPGPLNWLAQSLKKLIARALDWHVREQIEFNRQAIACVNATMEALNEVNRALVEFGKHVGELRASVERQARETADVASHWPAWRDEWERKLAHNEMQFLRSVADLQAGFQHRVTLMEANFRDLIRTQHADFTGALDRNTLEIQQRLWKDLEEVRVEYERVIHNELRLMRRGDTATRRRGDTEQTHTEGVSGRGGEGATHEASAFSTRFRGSEEHVREKQRFYVPLFAGCGAVLDIGCGRGEFLELMREAGVSASGVDLDEDSVALCRDKGLEAVRADLFVHLAELADACLDGILCAQVAEHLPPERLPEFVRLCAAKLQRGGILVIETPNPECLAALSVHFYLDPTHTRPIPHALLNFYMTEYGLGGIRVHELSPALESFPALASLPEDFRRAFFGGLDYAITGTKL